MQLVEYHPISAKEAVKAIVLLVKKVLPGIFLGDALVAGGIWKRNILVADIEKLGNVDASGNPCSKAQCQGSSNAGKG